MMYGQTTAGSWIYIGTQGILQGTYETFAAAARKHFGGSLKGTITVTAGLGGMGGAQPLAVTLNGGVIIAIEVDRERIQRRLDTRYLDTWTPDFDDALAQAEAAKRAGKALSIGLLGNAAEMVPEMVQVPGVGHSRADSQVREQVRGWVRMMTRMMRSQKKVKPRKVRRKRTSMRTMSLM